MRKVVLALAALALPLSLLPMASAVTPVSPASVTLTANSLISSELFTGVFVTSPLSGGTVFPVSMIATCTVGGNPCPSSTTYTWSSSSGVMASGSGSVASFTPQVFGSATVSVSVNSTDQLSGSAQMSVVLANTFVDSDLEADLAATATGLIDSCGPYTNLPGDDAYSAAQVGQAAFCPKPIGTTVGANFPSNGIDITQSCVLDPSACGIKPQLASAAANGANPPVCTSSACENRMRTAEFVNPINLRPYIPTKCIDNVTTNTLYATGGEAIQTVRGTERGCATRADIARAALTLAPTNVSVQLPPPAVPTPNLILNPTLDSSSDWFLGNAETDIGTPTGGSSTALKVSNENKDQYVVALASGVVPGQTYTASAYIRSPGSTGKPVSISIVGFDDDGKVLSDELTGVQPATWVTVGPKYDRIHVTGIAPSDNVGVRIGVPSQNKNVFIDDVALTSSSAVLPFSVDPILTYCQSGADPSQTVLRAAALNPAVEACNSEAALTKGYAASVLAWALEDKVTGATTTTTDFADISSSEARDFNELIAYGVPIPGSLRCPDNYSGDVCLNPTEALTRSQLATMLAPLLDSSVLSTNPATLTAQAPESVNGASAVPVVLRATLPAATRGAFTLSATGNGFCPVPTVTPASRTTATVTCFLEAPSSYSDATSTFSLSDSDGNNLASVSVSANTETTTPRIATLYLPSSEKDGDFNASAIIVDLEAGTTKVGVRSCNPSSQECPTTQSSFPQTGESRTLTSDTNPNSFVKSAETEIGSVSITNPVQGKATLTVDPFRDTSLPTNGRYVNGLWSFVIQACDGDNKCKSTLMTNFRTPEADAPVAPDTALAVNASVPATFTLESGSDLYDINRAPGTKSDPATVAFSSLPTEGVLTDSAGQLVIIDQSYPVLESFTYTPTANPGTFTASYAYTDTDEPALTSDSAVVTFTVS